MFITRMGVSVLIILMVLGGSAAAWVGEEQWRIVHGEVLQVYPQEHKLLVDLGSGSELLLLAEDCQILRQGAEVALASLRPIAPGALQDVLLWLNGQGLVCLILANYHVQEENGALVSYDIFGNVK